MKARKKNSNDEWKDVIYVQLEDSDILYKERYLEFQHDNLSTELKTYDQVEEEKHWQEVRESAAIAAMQGVMNFFGSLDYNRETIAKLAVEQADALVKLLKGE
jgi:hypothetical protein